MPEYRIGGKNAAETVEWLRSIANQVIEEHIGARREAGLDALGDGGSTLAPNRLRAHWKEMEPYVELLSPRQRRVVELRFREGMRYADIAARLGIPVGTVRSRLARARTRIDGLSRESAKPGEESPANPAYADLAHGERGSRDSGGGEPRYPGEPGSGSAVDADSGQSESGPGI